MSTTTLGRRSRERAPPRRRGRVRLAQYTLQQCAGMRARAVDAARAKVTRRGGKPIVYSGAGAGHGPSLARKLCAGAGGIRPAIELDPAMWSGPLDGAGPWPPDVDPRGPRRNAAHLIPQMARWTSRHSNSTRHPSRPPLLHTFTAVVSCTRHIKAGPTSGNRALTNVAMGIGMAVSRLPRERQSSQLSEYLSARWPNMAPRQTGRMNRSIDSRSDLYSLGVAFYECSPGTLPFTAVRFDGVGDCHIADSRHHPARSEPVFARGFGNHHEVAARGGGALSDRRRRRE